MTILGSGDLSPRRRRRGRRWARALLTLVVLAAAGAGAWFGWRHFHDDRGTATLNTRPTPCPTASPTPTPTPALAAPIRVLNGSLRPGLAAGAARQLQRWFHVPVARVGNAAMFVRGDSLIRYPAAAAADAQRLATLVVPPPRLVLTPTAGKVELDLGTRFDHITRPSPAASAAASTPAATGTACPAS
ncbi:MAG TPA: LytR C-terminal domain-containing protein [Mycobacteriales bacterium]|nr:LytR C-terminal domain-containing protein [Mycobacteriales bacterium]